MFKDAAEFDWRGYLLGDAEEELIGIPQEDRDQWVSILESVSLQDFSGVTVEDFLESLATDLFVSCMRY